MNDCMRSLCYETSDFRLDESELRRPPVLTERFCEYRLVEDGDGVLSCETDRQGAPVLNPRRLRDLCILLLTENAQLLDKMRCELLPGNIYPLLLTEAIAQREGTAVMWLVSHWPMRVLRLYDLLPLEDYLEEEYLTIPCETSTNDMSLLDYFVCGLLKLKPESNLKIIDFTRFQRDRKLAKELCRLPVLWMDPKSRTVDNLHEHMMHAITISKDKTQRFLNRIAAVYCNMDSEFMHGNKIEPISVELDLQIIIDDVPIGLSLQDLSPFKYKCNKLWLKPVPEIILPLDNINKLVNINIITHFEYEDALLPQDNELFASLMHMLGTLTSLTALSLPNSVDIKNNQQMASSLNKLIRKLKYIQKLNFSYCNLIGRLSTLLGGIKNRLIYLNLRDCRLNEEDLLFLSRWRCLATLKEVNLSCNNLSSSELNVIKMTCAMKRLACFSISFCQLNTHSLALIVRQLRQCSDLKTLCIQGYTPLPQAGNLELLSLCSHIRSLQKVALFPEEYAFPGNNDRERRMNRYHAFRLSYRYLKMRGRQDIEVQD